PDRRLTISGLRIRRESRPTHWDFEIELVRQTGSRRASAAPSDERVLDIDAHFAHVALGYTFAGRGSPRLAVEYERGSGDSDPGDGRWERFDALYGNRRIDLAPTGIYGALGRENIVTWGVRASRALGDRADTFIAFRTLKLAAAADAFASTGVRDSTGRSGRDAGAQVDARYRHWLRPNVLRLEVGATFLSRGDFFRTTPNANRQGDPLYVYSDVTYTFGSDRAQPGRTLDRCRVHTGPMTRSFPRSSVPSRLRTACGTRIARCADGATGTTAHRDGGR